MWVFLLNIGKYTFLHKLNFNKNAFQYVRSSSRLLGEGGLPQCILGYTLPSLDLDTPQRPDPPTSPLGLGLDTPPGQNDRHM